MGGEHFVALAGAWRQTWHMDIGADVNDLKGLGAHCKKLINYMASTLTSWRLACIIPAGWPHGINLTVLRPDGLYA